MEEKKPEPLPSFFADKIFGFNPFPKDDVRREQWEINARYAAEEIARMEATLWRTLPAETAPSQQFLTWALDSAGGFFDIIARHLLIFVVNGPASIVLYEECLTSMITNLLQKNWAPDKGRFGLSKNQFLFELQLRFKQRRAHWKVEAFKLAREAVQVEMPDNITAEARLRTDEKQAAEPAAVPSESAANEKQAETPGDKFYGPIINASPPPRAESGPEVDDGALLQKALDPVTLPRRVRQLEEQQAQRLESWDDFRNEFQSLAGKDCSLHAYGAYGENPFDVQKGARWACLPYDEHPGTMRVIELGKPERMSPECGLWVLIGRFDDEFLSRFRLSATSAGIALGSPKGTKPLVFWLHRLYVDRRENKSHRDCFADNGQAGIIPRVCEASVIFCRGLEEEALERQSNTLVSPTQTRSSASVKADLWRNLHDRFQSLTDEEQRTVPRNEDRYLCAFCDYTEHSGISPETGVPERGNFCLLTAPPGRWKYNADVSENFWGRFRSFAARAGVALGCPSDTNPEDFWLHRLYVHLCRNKSQFVLGRSYDTDTILRVCEASATFSSWLERQALERSALPPPNEGAPEVVAGNPRVELQGEKGKQAHLEKLRKQHEFLGAIVADTELYQVLKNPSAKNAKRFTARIFARFLERKESTILRWAQSKPHGATPSLEQFRASVKSEAGETPVLKHFFENTNSTATWVNTYFPVVELEAHQVLSAARAGSYRNFTEVSGRERGPRLKEHRDRVEFEDNLRSELAAIRERLENSASTAESLQKRFPDFKLWALLSSTIERKDLIEQEFKPKVLARTLTARKFAVGVDAIKKSRQLCNRHGKVVP